MSKSQQKRALPPTPSTSTKYVNVSDAIQSLLDTGNDSLSDRERRWFNDLSNCQKTLEQKESTINHLKIIVMEWKKKATEFENAYKEAQERLQDREQFLIKQHEEELKALTKVQVNQANDNLDIIIQLEQENQLLRQQLGQPIQPLTIHHPTSTTSLLCNNAEATNQAALENVSNNKENSDELIQRINDMVNAMEGTLHDFKNNTNYYQDVISTDIYSEDTNPSTPPTLISDTSSDDNNSFTDEVRYVTVAPKKKRSATIPNFLFRSNTKKKMLEEAAVIKRNQSLNESNNAWVQRKPIRIN